MKVLRQESRYEYRPNYGVKFKVPIGEYDVLVICFVNLTSREVWIIGKLPFEVADKKCNKNLLSPMSKRFYYGVLQDLTILESL